MMRERVTLRDVAEASLLLHTPPHPWTEQQKRNWALWTGNRPASCAGLCDAIREAIADTDATLARHAAEVPA